jgi:hypothetical protein
MTTNLNSSIDNSPFHYQTEKFDAADRTSLLPRSAWTSQVNYLRVLFKVKKRLDQIEDDANSSVV